MTGAQDIERDFGNAQGGVAGRWERSGGPELAGHGVKEPPQPWNRSAMADKQGSCEAQAVKPCPSGPFAVYRTNNEHESCVASLSPEQAAKVLRISRPLVYHRMDTGRLPFRQVGTHRRVLVKDVLALKSFEESGGCWPAR